MSLNVIDQTGEGGGRKKEREGGEGRWQWGRGEGRFLTNTPMGEDVKWLLKRGLALILMDIIGRLNM